MSIRSSEGSIMMQRKGSILCIAAIMILAVFLPLMANAGKEPPSRIPDKWGHITSDETWDDQGDKTFWVDDLIIDEGVTVTIAAEMRILPYADSHFWVRGTLIANGHAMRGQVQFGEVGGNSWEGLVINSTGSCVMRNITVAEAEDSCIRITGQSSFIENATLMGGDFGISIEDTDSAHTILNVYSSDPAGVGLLVRNSAGATIVDNYDIYGPQYAGIMMDTVSNIRVGGLFIKDSSMYYALLQDLDKVMFHDFWLYDTQTTHTTGGIALSGIVTNSQFVDGRISGTNYGLIIATTGGRNVYARELEIDGDVTQGIVNVVPDNKLDIDLIDCVIDAEMNTTYLDVSEPGLYVDFVNTTWDAADNMYIYNEAVLNVSWHLEAEVVDGRGDPLDINFKIFWDGMSPPYNRDIENGKIAKRAIMQYSQKGEVRPRYKVNDYQFQSNDYPMNMHKINDFVIYGYTRWDIVLDLAPFNDMPDEFHVDEDEWLELDLYDHFTDPEGLDLTFTIDHTENLNVVHTGGRTSGDLKIKNSQPDWYGTGWVKVVAVDTGKNETEKNFTIIIDPVNDAPRFTEPLPVLTVEEDGWTYYNFTGKVMDVEGSPVEISFPGSQDYTLEYNETTMNLTIRPAGDYFGMLKVEVNLSDGDVWTFEDLMINVTPVNDLPQVDIMMDNGTIAPLVEYDNTTEPVTMAYELVLEEDGYVEFRLNAVDVDSTNLTYYFMEEDLSHGAIEVETYQIEVIVNETTNQTEMQNVTVPMNFTYTPAENDFEGDLVRFVVDDGEGATTVRVWFRVTPVNDPIVFDAPAEWNVTVDVDVASTIDIGPWISDADGDSPIITTSSDFISVEGTILTLLYNNSYEGSTETVTVTVSDGFVQVPVQLLVTIIQVADDDDDDDDDAEPTIGKPEVKGKGDKWVVEAEGTEGQDLWVVVEDDDGTRKSYKMTYSEGRYSADIPKEDAEEGFDYWISDAEDGDPVDNSLRGTLPSVKEEEEDEFPWLVVLLIIIILVLLIIVVLLYARGKGAGEEYEE